MMREDAIYARQSVNREDSISIESQIEICEFETRGESHRTFVDRGFSGKNTDRPKFREMMDVVCRGEIKRIICYKLDRCSRSVRDFVAMMEVLQKYDVEFCSCTEKFDTSSPMGRAMLNICVVFAQLERETIQMRVEDAYKSMSQKGFYMGGRLPMGFDREPYLLNGKNTTRYVPNEDEALAIRLIYDTYKNPTANTGDVIRTLLHCGIKNPQTKDGHWNGNRIQSIVCNPIYVRADLSVYNFFKENGAIIHNPPEDFIGLNGCYLYEEKDSACKRLRIAGQHLILAPHEGLVSAEAWLACRKKIKFSGDVMHDNSIKINWLSKKIKCGKCGYALVIRTVPKTAIRNYVCSKFCKTHGLCEGVGKLKAETLECIVFDEIQKKLVPFTSLSASESETIDLKGKEIAESITVLQNEIDGLVQSLMAANAVLTKYINERISMLERKKASLTQELHALKDRTLQKQKGSCILSSYMDKWDELSISDKMAVVDIMIQVIRVTEHNVQIEWKL